MSGRGDSFETIQARRGRWSLKHSQRATGTTSHPILLNQLDSREARQLSQGHPANVQSKDENQTFGHPVQHSLHFSTFLSRLPAHPSSSEGPEGFPHFSKASRTFATPESSLPASASAVPGLFTWKLQPTAMGPSRGAPLVCGVVR